MLSAVSFKSFVHWRRKDNKAGYDLGHDNFVIDK